MSNRIVFRVHAVKRMFSRKISELEVYTVLQSGKVIEAYPDDKPYPSYLILGWSGPRPIHVVAAEDKTANETIVITVYEPDKNLWHEDFKRRKK